MMRKLSLILAVLIIPAMVAFAAGQTEPGQKAILKVWDQWTEEGAQTGAAQAITMIEKSFMEKHPNVTVERTPMQVEEMTNTLKPDRGRQGTRRLLQRSGDRICRSYHSSGLYHGSHKGSEGAWMD